MAETIADVSALLSWWHPDRNSQAPEAVPARSYNAAWWRCPAGHAFELSPRALQRQRECPTCALGEGSLAADAPALAAVWHPSKNEGLMPTEISGDHAGACWWACSEGHGFQRSPRDMGRDASCPHCRLASSSLAALHPRLAGQWHPTRNRVPPEQVRPDHAMAAWWRCDRGHEFQQTVRARTQGHGGCPVCYRGWSVESIRDFVRSLLEHIDALNPSETFALAMQAGALEDPYARAFVMALSTGRFPSSELERFARGQPSLVDEFANDQDFSLEILETCGGQKRGQERGEDDPFALPMGPDGEGVEVSLGLEASQALSQASEVLDEQERLPVIQTRDALVALDALVASVDAETVRFLIDSAQAKLWRHAFVDAHEARRQAAAFRGDAYAGSVRDRFLAELDAAESMALPGGYAFRPRPGAPIADPHLMQRHVAVRVEKARRFGNWSGMGAGKTLSALLATRLVDAHLTVICCPNSVVGNWAEEIGNAFPTSEVQCKTWKPRWADPLEARPRYLVMNYEQFQQPASEENLVGFLARHTVDFVVIDEIHFAKQRSSGEASQRKRLVQGLVLEAGKANDGLCVLGMSGTPVINDLHEGKSLVELITGHRHDDLRTTPTVQNCMRLYQKFVTLGTRWCPDYATGLDESQRPEISCHPFLDEIREAARGTVLDLERVLTRVRLPTILEHIEPGQKTLIYTHYVDGIVRPLRDAITDAGFRVGLYTGGTGDEGLEEFLAGGDVDVLIASSRVSTGVDGLQHVCNKLIINCLPWTRAEYEQLRGRLWRQGSAFDQVSVVIPVTYAHVGGQRWSYCESKLLRLAYKKSIADAAVDGVVPEGNLRTPAQAQQDIMDWLDRLRTGHAAEIVRPVIQIPLSGEPSEVERRQARYGDFSRVNRRWYRDRSADTHQRLSQNPEEWAHYHTLYRELRQNWDVVPVREEIRWLEEREGLVVGDFGCGEALVAAEVGDRHIVHSFDHVAIDHRVVACDMARVPLGDGVLDVAIFSLSLMGANFTDYLREARRCLRLDGWLHIWEPTSRFDDAERFCQGLGGLGFEVLPPRIEGRFTLIQAAKNSRTPAPVELSF